MPLFFFDIHEGEKQSKDEDGVELAGFEEARREAQRVLPEIAYHEIPKDGDRRTYVVLVTDEDQRPVYTATLSYAGIWLLR